jgi:hypothetical protein
MDADYTKFKVPEEDKKAYEAYNAKKIEDLIRSGLTKEEALIEHAHGFFPIIQLIKYQKGKCYNCKEDLNVSMDNSPSGDYDTLIEWAMKFDDFNDDCDIGTYYRLFCSHCSDGISFEEALARQR